MWHFLTSIQSCFPYVFVCNTCFVVLLIQQEKGICSCLFSPDENACHLLLWYFTTFLRYRSSWYVLNALLCLFVFRASQNADARRWSVCPSVCVCVRPVRKKGLSPYFSNGATFTKLTQTVHLDMVYWCNMVVCVLDLLFTFELPWLGRNG